MGAHAAARVPTTLAAPARAVAQSSGMRATGTPARRRRSPRRRTAAAPGPTTSTGPSAAAATSTGYGSAAGGRRRVATPAARASRGQAVDLVGRDRARAAAR